MSDDDTIDPDSAVKALEDMATTLKEATDDEKRAFVVACAEEADRLKREAGPGYTKTADFIRRLPEAIGLCDVA
jgi:hypothetical protein